MALIPPAPVRGGAVTDTILNLSHAREQQESAPSTRHRHASAGASPTPRRTSASTQRRTIDQPRSGDLDKLKVDPQCLSRTGPGPKAWRAHRRHQPPRHNRGQMHGHERAACVPAPCALPDRLAWAEMNHIAGRSMAQETPRTAAHDRLTAQIDPAWKKLCIAAALASRVTHSLSVSFSYVRGGVMIMALRTSRSLSVQLQPQRPWNRPPRVRLGAATNWRVAPPPVRCHRGRSTPEEKVASGRLSCADCRRFRDMYQRGISTVGQMATLAPRAL